MFPARTEARYLIHGQCLSLFAGFDVYKCMRRVSGTLGCTLNCLECTLLAESALYTI